MNRHRDCSKVIDLRVWRGMKSLIKRIKNFVTDVDGTLTDGKIYMGENGELCKVFDIKDGCGIHDILIPNGILPIIITGRTSKMLENRCKELGVVDLYQGTHNKIEKMKEILKKTNTKPEEVAYIGDDINDLTCMEYIKENGGLVGCPADAVDRVKAKADFICTKNGGNGAVREFIEYICF